MQNTVLKQTPSVAGTTVELKSELRGRREKNHSHMLSRSLPLSCIFSGGMNPFVDRGLRNSQHMSRALGEGGVEVPLGVVVPEGGGGQGRGQRPQRRAPRPPPAPGPGPAGGARGGGGKRVLLPGRRC